MLAPKRVRWDALHIIQKITAILSIFCSVGKVQGIHAGTFASCYITRMVPIAVAVSLQKVLRELVKHIH